MIIEILNWITVPGGEPILRGIFILCIVWAICDMIAKIFKYVFQDNKK